jgi:hypothetical protein
MENGGDDWEPLVWGGPLGSHDRAEARATQSPEYIHADPFPPGLPLSAIPSADVDSAGMPFDLWPPEVSWEGAVIDNCRTRHSTSSRRRTDPARRMDEVTKADAHGVKIGACVIIAGDGGTNKSDRPSGHVHGRSHST